MCVNRTNREMGTEVLRPQDWLTQRIRVAPVVFHRRKNFYGNGSGLPKFNNTNRKPTVRSDRLEWPEQRRRSPEPMISKRSASTGDLRYKQPHNIISTSSSNNNLMLGQVTILRRGESLETKVEANKSHSGEETTDYGTGRLGPDPKMVPKQVRLGLPDIYAGSAFSMSPSPRALPLPSFFNKKKGTKCVDDSATRDLRRLLRLD